MFPNLTKRLTLDGWLFRTFAPRTRAIGRFRGDRIARLGVRRFDGLAVPGDFQITPIKRGRPTLQGKDAFLSLKFDGF